MKTFLLNLIKSGFNVFFYVFFTLSIVVSRPEGQYRHDGPQGASMKRSPFQGPKANTVMTVEDNFRRLFVVSRPEGQYRHDGLEQRS